MERMQNKNEPFDNYIGNFLGVVNCLVIISDIKNYKEWLNENYHIHVNQIQLRGYKLLFETLFRMLVNDIERNLGLDLTSDRMFVRASFTGIPVSVLPNTCEKTILLKNLRDHFCNIDNTNSWGKFEAKVALLSQEVLYPFNSVRKISFTTSKMIDLDTAITYSSMFQTYIFLNDTRKGIPHGYVPTMIKDEEITFGYQFEAARKWRDAFEGYKYGVQYLWSQLLKDKYKQSATNRINEANDWESFDKYFEKIQLKIINPLEKSTKAFMGYDNFVFTKQSPKQYFKALTVTKLPDKELSPKELLRRYFLWYPICFINCRDMNFSGIPVLTPLLKGMVNDNEKIQMIRLIHGDAEDHRRDYSYGVLIGLYGIMSDASGWMLFWDCCADQGSTSKSFKDFEESLQEYVEKGFVEIQSIRIEKNRFIELMQKEIVPQRIS
jgi:hypothetical protein